jgi:hypothetical protein
LRATPSGTSIAELAAGSTFRTLDFMVTDGAGTEARYYKIASGANEGYVYAGDSSDYLSWASAISAASPEAGGAAIAAKGLAAPGDIVRIVSAAGTTLRKSPAGTQIVSIPQGATLSVTSIEIKGNESSAYYGVSYRGQTGFIYSGDLLPVESVAFWTAIVGPAAGQGVLPGAGAIPASAVLASGVPYRFLRTCPATSCSESESYVVGAAYNPACQNASCSARGDLISVLGEQSGWAHVRSAAGGGEGYLPASDIAEFTP